MNLVPYHLDIDGNYYSLSYSHPSESEAQEEAIEGADLSDYSTDTRDIVDTVISLFDEINV